MKKLNRPGVWSLTNLGKSDEESKEAVLAGWMPVCAWPGAQPLSIWGRQCLYVKWQREQGKIHKTANPRLHLTSPMTQAAEVWNNQK